MKHSKKYDMIKTFYMRKMWDEKKVRNAVVKGWITADEFEEITGIEYSSAGDES